MEASYGTTEKDVLLKDLEPALQEETSIFDDSKDVTVKISSPKKKLVWLTVALLLAGLMIAKMFGGGPDTTAAAMEETPDFDMLGWSPHGPCGTRADCPSPMYCCRTRYTGSGYVCIDPDGLSSPNVGGCV